MSPLLCDIIIISCLNFSCVFPTFDHFIGDVRSEQSWENLKVRISAYAWSLIILFRYLSNVGSISKFSFGLTIIRFAILFIFLSLGFVTRGLDLVLFFGVWGFLFFELVFWQKICVIVFHLKSRGTKIAACWPRKFQCPKWAKEIGLLHQNIIH